MLFEKIMVMTAYKSVDWNYLHQNIVVLELLPLILIYEHQCPHFLNSNLLELLGVQSLFYVKLLTKKNKGMPCMPYYMWWGKWKIIYLYKIRIINLQK